MSTTEKTGMAKTFSLLAIVFTAFQLMIPGIPGITADSIKTITAIDMGLVSVFTLLYQYFHQEIKNKAMWPTIILVGLGILDVFNTTIIQIPISETWGKWISFIITTLIMLLNILSKTMFPTEEAKQVAAEKKANEF